MSRSKRQQFILDYLESQRSVTYTELEKLFSVSNMTVRRDIDLLAHEGLLIKTLGGAKASEDMYETEVTGRLAINKPEKSAIAMEAVKYIFPRESIYMDGSSTCLELARKMVRQVKDLTVVTNSVLIHMELARSKEITIIGLGGQHDPASYCLTGPETELQATKYYYDKVFLSTKGFSPKEGTFESSAANFRIKQIVAEKSSEVILLSDHTKFGQKSLCNVLDISQIDTVYTDNLTSANDIRELENKGKRVVIADLEKELCVR